MQARTLSLQGLNVETVNGPRDAVRANMTAKAALRQALDDRLSINADAAHYLALIVITQKHQLQIDERGLAKRIEMMMVVDAKLTNKQTTETVGFNVAVKQSMARKDSGADELRTEKRLIEAAAAQLSERLLSEISRRLSADRLGG